ncbi:MAG: hypothetical protein J6M02_05700 [Clostridia bacterium]|nr:hypothetical protein [Clostridia bacterium]
MYSIIDNCLVDSVEVTTYQDKKGNNRQQGRMLVREMIIDESAYNATTTNYLVGFAPERLKELEQYKGKSVSLSLKTRTVYLEEKKVKVTFYDLDTIELV